MATRMCPECLLYATNYLSQPSLNPYRILHSECSYQLSHR